MLKLVENLLEVTPTISSVCDNHSESIFLILKIYLIIRARNIEVIN